MYGGCVLSPHSLLLSITCSQKPSIYAFRVTGLYCQNLSVFQTKMGFSKLAFFAKMGPFIGTCQQGSAKMMSFSFSFVNLPLKMCIEHQNYTDCMMSL